MHAYKSCSFGFFLPLLHAAAAAVPRGYECLLVPYVQAEASKACKYVRTCLRTYVNDEAHFQEMFLPPTKN